MTPKICKKCSIAINQQRKGIKCNNAILCRNGNFFECSIKTRESIKKEKENVSRKIYLAKNN